MRIDSMDAINRLNQLDGMSSQQKTKTNSPENEPIQQEQGNSVSISEKTVINAIEKANKAISFSNRQLEFSVHEKTKEIMVKVIDSETKEVIREIPPEKILDMVANLLEMAGILVDERR